jgi:hypothetical protein
MVRLIFCKMRYLLDSPSFFFMTMSKNAALFKAAMSGLLIIPSLDERGQRPARHREYELAQARRAGEGESFGVFTPTPVSNTGQAQSSPLPARASQWQAGIKGEEVV